MVELGNTIVSKLGWSADDVSFHVYDVEDPMGKPLNSLLDYAGHGAKMYDIITMFSLNMWIKDPLRVAAWAIEHSRLFIIETNGSVHVQQQSISLLRRDCARLEEKTNTMICADCGDRRLWVCTTGSLPCV
jgi:hypothetical protein